MMNKEKVFVIGFQKTGTTTLETVLRNLGYTVAGGDKNLIKFKDREELKQYIRNKLKNFDAVQDMAWPLVYRELYELYPNAKFILTYRDPDLWIKSVVKYFAKIKNTMHQRIYKVDYAEGNEEAYLKIYKNFNAEVIDFFKDKENFLFMDMKSDFNYKTLYPFLGIKEIPTDLFPKSRSNTQRLSKFKIYRELRSLYWNFKRKQ